MLIQEILDGISESDLIPLNQTTNMLVHDFNMEVFDSTSPTELGTILSKRAQIRISVHHPGRYQEMQELRERVDSISRRDLVLMLMPVYVWLRSRVDVMYDPTLDVWDPQPLIDLKGGCSYGTDFDRSVMKEYPYINESDVKSSDLLKSMAGGEVYVPRLCGEGYFKHRLSPAGTILVNENHVKSIDHEWLFTKFLPADPYRSSVSFSDRSYAVKSICSDLNLMEYTAPTFAPRLMTWLLSGEGSLANGG